MKKKFTLLQLFSILDGRLSTEIGDVYEMLNHITGDELMTHHLPTAMKYLKTVNPKWFQDLKDQLTIHLNLCPIKERTQEQFLWLINSITKENESFYIPALTVEEKKDFGKFMIDNSLLLGNKK